MKQENETDSLISNLNLFLRKSLHPAQERGLFAFAMTEQNSAKGSVYSETLIIFTFYYLVRVFVNRILGSGKRNMPHAFLRICILEFCIYNNLYYCLWFLPLLWFFISKNTINNTVYSPFTFSECQFM